MQNYNNLRVTARARAVVSAAYRATETLPRREMFGLTSQMRRAAISAALNIVEGCSRSSTAELIRFLQISIGSAMELEFCCILCGDLHFGTPESIDGLLALNKTLQKELAALIGSLRRRKKSGNRS
jgi:four helix bundle protein